MRKTMFAAVTVAIALVVQLSVINGLRLPGGAVPDLLLVLVAALGLADGPFRGMIIGFAAGLCLDLAPPASQVIGQYALVFCLAGWAAGRLSGLAVRSAVRSAAVLALVVAAAEALSAALGIALEPAQVTVAEVRQVLPAAVGYDLLILPFILYLVLAASRLLDGGLDSVKAGSLLAVPDRKDKRRRQRQAHEPRLVRGARRPGDGWVGGAPHGPVSRRAPARPVPRLRPADGVAGSAAGLVHRPRLPAAPVNLRLAGPRRGDGAIGNAVGMGLSGHVRQRGRHPGLLAGPGPGRGFRPHGGELGGSASGQRRLGPAPAPARAQIRFGGHRGDASVGRALGQTGLGGPRRPVIVPALHLRARHPATPKLRPSGGQRGRASQRPAAAPRFRRKSASLRLAGASSGLVAGGVLDQATFRALRRRRAGTPRLRLGRARRGSGVLGGSALAAPSARPAVPKFRTSTLKRRTSVLRKQPRFGYGRRSPLSVLTRSRIGGRWLARKRVGSRSGLWMIRRTGGQW